MNYRELTERGSRSDVVIWRPANIPVWNSRKVTTVGTFFGIFLTKIFSQARGLTDETHDEGQPRKALHSTLKQPARTGGELRRSRAGQTT